MCIATYTKLYCVQAHALQYSVTARCLILTRPAYSSGSKYVIMSARVLQLYLTTTRSDQMQFYILNAHLLQENLPCRVRIQRRLLVSVQRYFTMYRPNFRGYSSFFNFLCKGMQSSLDTIDHTHSLDFAASWLLVASC